MTVFGLAPMEGVSDWAFRLWMSQASSPTFMNTPFLRATDTFPRLLPPDFAPELKAPHLYTYSLIPQVMASRPEDFIRAAKLFLADGAPFVDLNCGCPSPNPVSGGAGSSLLKDSAAFIAFIQTIASGMPKQSFSVKMRTGFHDASEFHAKIEGLKDLPLRQLTVHGRTRDDRYDGDARWDLIAAAKASLPFPVLASGDILSHAGWLHKRRCHPEIDRVIIGRGALRNPWIFSELQKAETVRISPRALVFALRAFALLTDLAEHSQADLEKLVQEGLWLEAAGTDEAAWRRLWERLRALQGSAESTRFAFGRLKMLWNSLRSSLPEPYFEPKLLRSKDQDEFFAAVLALGEESFHLRHQEAWDWLFTSSKKRNSAEPIA